MKHRRIINIRVIQLKFKKLMMIKKLFQPNRGMQFVR